MLGIATMTGAAVTNLVTTGIEHATAKFVLSRLLVAVALFIAWQLRARAASQIAARHADKTRITYKA
jgi:hypothetical protein